MAKSTQKKGLENIPTNLKVLSLKEYAEYKGKSRSTIHRRTNGWCPREGLLRLTGEQDWGEYDHIYDTVYRICETSRPSIIIRAVEYDQWRDGLQLASQEDVRREDDHMRLYGEYRGVNAEYIVDTEIWETQSDVFKKEYPLEKCVNATPKSISVWLGKRRGITLLTYKEHGNKGQTYHDNKGQTYHDNLIVLMSKSPKVSILAVLS